MTSGQLSSQSVLIKQMQQHEHTERTTKSHMRCDKRRGHNRMDSLHLSCCSLLLVRWSVVHVHNLCISMPNMSLATTSFCPSPEWDGMGRTTEWTLNMPISCFCCFLPRRSASSFVGRIMAGGLREFTGRWIFPVSPHVRRYG